MRTIIRAVPLIFWNLDDESLMQSSLQKDRTIRIASCVFIILMALIGFATNNSKHRMLTALYSVQTTIACLLILASGFTIRYNIKTKIKSPEHIELQPRKHEELEVQDKIEILYFNRSHLRIKVLPNVLRIRPHIIGCIIKHIDLSIHANYKRILSLQHELHKNICQKQTIATIALHDLASISGSLIYSAGDCKQLRIIPLSKSSRLVSAKSFYDELYQHSELAKKYKLVNKHADRDEYLKLLKDQDEFPYLCDGSGNVISIPPLTIDERTKLSPSTKSILIQITSPHSMNICRGVMNLFLYEMIKTQLGKKSDDPDFRQTLTVQQIRIVDSEGKLITCFPSRSDLDWDEISKEIILMRS